MVQELKGGKSKIWRSLIFSLWTLDQGPLTPTECSLGALDGSPLLHMCVGENEEN